MARYVTTVRTPLSPAQAFAYMADLRNFAEWDPGVKKVVQVKGDGAGIDAEFDVTVSGTTLRYVTEVYSPNTELLAVAKSSTLKSTDRVTVLAEGGSTLVTYDALLELNGILRFADPLLRLAFGRIGDRAAAGLRRVLDGEDVPVMTRQESTVQYVVDAVIEAPVFTSFTRLGYDARSRLAGWKPIGDYDATGRVVLVTGATSGLGLVTAEQLAAVGATVVLLGRDEAKTKRVSDEIMKRTGSALVSTVVADMGDLVAVRRVADELTSRLDRLDVLIHNAGALSATRQESPQGTELTVASQVVGPFLLTNLLLPLLQQSTPGRVLTMSSGGMYASPLRVDGLQMGDDYKGSEQYARAKRAQVTLNEMWAEKVPASEVVFHAMHPGWADTPGVRDSLPTFRKIVGPLLRSPQQGADTMVWLALDDGEPLTTNGRFWLDRHERSIHKLPTTRSSDTANRRAQLWEWVATAAQ